LPLGITAARVDRPQRIADLAADQRTVIGVAGPERDVGLAAREIEVAIAHHELDMQARIAVVKSLDQAGGGQAHDDRLGTGHAHDADGGAPLGLHPLLERRHGVGDALRMRKHGLPEFGQLVAGRLALHQALAQAALQLRETPLHRGLIDAQRTRRRQHAAVLRHGEKVAEIVPVEHRRIMHSCGPSAQTCGCRSVPRPTSLGRQRSAP